MILFYTLCCSVPFYSEVYHQFSKQWHYSMDIKTCRDPLTNVYTETPLNYATNSYYPPGTVCATEINNQFCPTSGESGSPLMVRDEQSRYIISGLKSFIKGRVEILQICFFFFLFLKQTAAIEFFNPILRMLSLFISAVASRKF